MIEDITKAVKPQVVILFAVDKFDESQDDLSHYDVSGCGDEVTVRAAVLMVGHTTKAQVR